MNEIGTLFSPHLIEEGVLGTLQAWLPLYLEEIKAQYDIELPSIASWGLIDEEDERWPEQALPALIVIAEPTRGDPEKNAQDGWYRAEWPFQVTVIVEHPQRVWARKIAQLYGAAIRGAILQRRSLRGAGRVTDWMGERLPFEAKQSRTEAASQNFFLVKQDQVVSWKGGPKVDVPPDSPPGEGAEVAGIEIAVEVDE